MAEVPDKQIWLTEVDDLSKKRQVNDIGDYNVQIAVDAENLIVLNRCKWMNIPSGTHLKLIDLIVNCRIAHLLASFFTT